MSKMQFPNTKTYDNDLNGLGSGFNHFDFDYHVQLAQKLTGHQYCFYGVITSNQWGLVAHQHHDQTKHYFNVTQAYSSAANILKRESLFSSFQSFVQHYYQLNIQSMGLMVFKSDIPEQAYVLVLCSEKIHQIEQADWLLLCSHIQNTEYQICLQSKIDGYQKQTAQLSEESSNKSKYLSIISHDLKAPFHGILGCLDILVHEADTLKTQDEAERLLQYVYDASHSTYSLLENLLHWSMTQDGYFKQHPVHFRLSDVIQQIFDVLSLSAYRKQVHFKLNMDVELYIYADIRMVNSILQNLIANALKFTAADSQYPIQVIAVRDHDYVKIMIKDYGIGMTEFQLNKLFQEKVAISTLGTSRESGTGLGLLLCKRFIEMNNGTISVQSLLEEGTCFTVHLPLGNKEI